MIRRARRAFEVAKTLRVSEFVALAPAALVVRAVDLSLRSLGSARTISGLARVPRRTRLVPAIERFRRHARVVQLAGNHGPLPARCLPQALTLWAWLRWHGADGDVMIGVPAGDAVPQEFFQAHAWLELRGEHVTDEPHAVSELASFGRPLVAASTFASTTR